MSNYREYKAEFEDGDVTLDHASLSKRTDSVSGDYLTAVSSGPVALQDPDQGLLVKSWRIQDRDRDVYIASSNGVEWENEELLFSYTGDAITEIDLSWQGNADPVVAAVRPTGTGGEDEVWVYYYDGAAADFIFESKVTGRTPRGCIDRIFKPEDSTNYVFYIDDDESKIRALDQRDRYNIAYDAIAVDDPGTLYLEVAAKADYPRIQIEAVRHDVDAGRYERLIFHSPLYPTVQEEPGATGGASVQSMEIIQTIFRIYQDETTSATGSAEALSLAISVPIISHEEETSATGGADVVSIEISQPLVLHDEESYATGGAEAKSIEIEDVVITTVQEGYGTGGAEVKSITLETV